MPILEQAKEALQRRYTNCYYDDFGNENCGSSTWYSYGRWIVLAAIVVGAFFIFLIFSCITARRRRRTGQQPFRFTGWAAGNHGQPQFTGGNQQYYPSQPAPYAGNQGWNQPPPQYGVQRENDGSYYGNQAPKPAYDGQQNGVELQQPAQAYQGQRGGDGVYSAPEGPPPGQKSDGIVR